MLFALFGRPLVALGRPLVDLGRPWVALWSPLVALWSPMGRLWSPFGHLGAPGVFKTNLSGRCLVGLTWRNIQFFLGKTAKVGIWQNRPLGKKRVVFQGPLGDPWAKPWAKGRKNQKPNCALGKKAPMSTYDLCSKTHAFRAMTFFQFWHGPPRGAPRPIPN